MDPQHDTDGEARHKALRFFTAGSVDDGKSTLIGRFLLDSRAILADQLDALQRYAVAGAIDLSRLTDGLEAEREQGITIDVAYRYFATPRRKFIIADAPGHEQYTRNMVTAAAGSDAAVVLVDITKLDLSARPVRLLPQTRRHSLLAQLLRVPSIVFAVNKLDAVADPQVAFEAVRAALLEFAEGAGIRPAGIVPVSALRGDNVAVASAEWPWYDGAPLLELLEDLPAVEEAGEGALLLPVQYVAREGDGTGHQPRTFWGRIAHGTVRAGDVVRVHPAGQTATVVEVRHAGGAVERGVAGQSAGLVLDRLECLARLERYDDFDRVAASWRARLLSEPGTAYRFHLLRAERLGSAGSVSLAAMEYDAADRLRPNDPAVPLAKARMYEAARDTERARAAYREALRRRPGLDAAEKGLKALDLEVRRGASDGR